MIFIGVVSLLIAGTLMYLALRTASEQRTHAARERWGAPEDPVHRSRSTARNVRPTRPRNAPQPEPGDAFRFSPELFEYRALVIEKLEERGFSWFSHYSAVDCLHDVHGLEVCGIHERDDALKIRNILVQMFPDWRPG